MPLDKSEGQRLVKTSLALIKQAIERHRFLEKNSRVLVGVSGGVDSLVLILLLIEYNERYRQRWHINACHVDHQFPGWDTRGLKNFFLQHHIPHTIVRTTAGKRVKNLEKKCYACSRERRKKLLEVAEKKNIFQIALAHHTQDIAETTLLNMIFNGEISTVVPKQSVIQGRFFFIRPLYYFDKEKIMTLARIYGLPEKSNICPYYKESKREMVRGFLESIKKDNPDVYKNIFRSIFHIKKTYMPN